MIALDGCCSVWIFSLEKYPTRVAQMLVCKRR